MSTVPVIQGELVHLVSENMALRFDIPQLEEGEEVGGDELYAMFAVDKSGSMSGGPIRDARGAAESLTTKLRRMDVPVSLYLFDNTCKEMSSDVEGYDSIVEKLQRVEGGGGTVFRNVINLMTNKIIEKKLMNVFCVWLTDGRDGGGLRGLIPVMEQFKETLEANGVSIAVHCIGFSSGHDAELLTRLSQSGTRPGTFQYVPQGGRIPVAVNNVYELAFVSATWARFIGGENTYKVSIERSTTDTKTEKLRALVYVSEDDLEDCKVEIHKGSTVIEAPIEPVRGDIKDFKDLVTLVTAFVAAKVTQSLEGPGEGSGARLGALRPLIQETERRLSDLRAEASRMRPFRFRALQPFFDSTNELIETFYKTLNEIGTNDLSNVQLAFINGLANKIILKKSLESKIIKETGPNFGLLLGKDDIVDQLVASFDKQSVAEKHAQVPMVKCALSGQNWIDLAANGDCLCVSFYVERPQNLMGDPLDLKISAVNTVMMSHDSFLNSPFFETKAGQMIQGQKSYQHGTVPPDACDVVPGFPKEKINAIMPIFIADDHWTIAQHRIVPIIGYDITVDVLGFRDDQILIFPFFLMATAHATMETQDAELVFSHIRDTCMQVYKENKEKLLPKVQELIENATGKKNYEVFGNIGASLCLMYCAMHSGDVGDIKYVLPFFLEEALRKNYPTPENKLHELTMKFLNIDMAPHTEPIKQALLDFKTSFAEQFRVLKSGSKVEGQASVEEHKVGDVQISQFEFTGRLDSPSEAAVAELNKVLNALGNTSSQLGVAAKSISLFGLEVKNLESLGLATVEQKLALILQCNTQSRNNDRVAALEAGTVINPFDEGESVRYVQKAYSDAVNRETLAFKGNLMNQLQGKEAEQRAVIFSNTEDLEEAAGALYGASQGGQYFTLYYKALLQPNVPHVIEKIKMLTHGHFQEVKLINDQPKNNPQFVTWNPNSKKVYKLWNTHFNVASKEEWQIAIPLKTEYFDHQYARKEGNFVPYSHPRRNCIDPRHWEDKPERQNSQRGKNKHRGNARGRGRGGRYRR